MRLDPPRALHGFFGSHPRSSPTPSNADTPTPNHTRRPHETPSFPTFDSADTGGGYPHSPLLFPAQFSPLARGQGPVVRLDPPRALHGFFGSHPRSSPTPSNADTPTPNHTRRPHETPSFPTFDSADTGGGYPHSPLLFPAQFSPLAWGQGPLVRLDPPRALHGFFGSHPRSSPTYSTAQPTPTTDPSSADTRTDQPRPRARSRQRKPHRHTLTTPRAQPTTDSTATPSGVHFAGVDTVTDVTDATTANDRQRWFTGDTATPAFVGSPGTATPATHAQPSHHRLEHAQGVHRCRSTDDGTPPRPTLVRDPPHRPSRRHTGTPNHAQSPANHRLDCNAQWCTLRWRRHRYRRN